MNLEVNTNTLSTQSALFLSTKDGWTPERENYFILFRNPLFSISFQKDTVTFNSLSESWESKGEPLSILEQFLGKYIAVGYFGYEFSGLTEEGFTPIREKEGESFPDMFFLFFREEDGIYGRVEDLETLARKGFFGRSITPKNNFDFKASSNMSQREFMRMVKRAKEYIASGDIYQVNLSQRFTVPFGFSPFLYSHKLFKVQPVPFTCCIDFGRFQLMSGSMELFLRKKGKQIITKPIKGTRKRGRTTEEDEFLRRELLTSEKERAENLMIADLMRNDLGRVCEYGSIGVNRLFHIDSYHTLHQMLSEVEGYIREDIKITDIIQATFPPGSVTGAPKKRAVEIIDELEPHFRGPYCGAIGIFYPKGDFILSVAIRILIAKEDRGTFWVGGGIVWDSDPQMEYEETLIKAQALMKALELELR